jgi:hypothetical protein
MILKVTNERKVISVEWKVKVMQQIENGKKKVGVCWEFGLQSERSG